MKQLRTLSHFTKTKMSMRDRERKKRITGEKTRERDTCTRVYMCTYIHIDGTVRVLSNTSIILLL